LLRTTNTVSGFLKEKLPAPIAGQVDNVLSGAGGMTDKIGDMASKVGGSLAVRNLRASLPPEDLQRHDKAGDTPE
jgi:hypothetical protein